jgi:hypothetical protein
MSGRWGAVPGLKIETRASLPNLEQFRRPEGVLNWLVTSTPR